MNSIGSRRLAVGLAVSLALNVFALGFIVARLSLGHPPLPPPTPKPGFGARQFLHAEEGPAMRRLLKPYGAKLRPQRRAMREARTAVADAVVSEPVDEAKLRQALDALREQTAESQKAMHESLLGVVGDMSPTERKKIARAAGKKREHKFRERRRRERAERDALPGMDAGGRKQQRRLERELRREERRELHRKERREERRHDRPRQPGKARHGQGGRGHAPNHPAPDRRSP